MRRAAVLSLVVLTFFAAACQTSKTAKTPEPPKNPQAAVNERVGIMKSFIGALGASNQYAQGKITAAAAKAKLDPARAGLDRLDGLFVPGTALGDKGVTESRALATIFGKNSDFDDKLAELASAFGDIDKALSHDSKTQAASAVTRTKNACVSCHNKYRTPDE